MDASVHQSSRSTGRFSDLVHRIYDAAVHPERWNSVVGEIAQSLDADKALLFTPYVAPQHGGMLFPHNISEQVLQTWGSAYIDQDIWARHLLEKDLWQTGAVRVDEEMTPWSEFLASPFYRDFLRGIGIGRVCVGLVFGGEEGLKHTTIACFRSIDAPAFEAKDKEWLKSLTSHVSRALGIMQRLDTQRLQKVSMLAAFDRLAFGVVLLDGEMKVLHVNHAGQRVLDRRDGLGLNEFGQLENLVTRKGAPKLSRWLQTVTSSPPEQQQHFLDNCVVARGAGASCYLIQCSDIPASAGWHAQDRAVRHVAFILDPASLQLPPPERLMELFALTPTQAQVALAFANGATYEQVARKQGISVETVRAHVKEIYPKTRVNRQADLVRLVLSLGQSAV